MEKRIEIICKTDGTFTIEAFGFEGNTCEKATSSYEQALGGETIEEHKKQEYYNVNLSEKNSTKVNGG